MFALAPEPVPADPHVRQLGEVADRLCREFAPSGWLSRLAARIDGARGSTAICLVLHTRTGELRWARAGHGPPLLLQPAGPPGSVDAPGGVRFLDDGHGIVLGFSDSVAAVVPYTEGHTVLAPGASVVLYTDGLIERRGEVIDDGLHRLAAAAAHHARAAPQALVAAMLHAGLDGAEPSDDVALIVARLLPAPLHRRIPAIPAQLMVLRRDVADWAAAAALPDILVEDLQLALGKPSPTPSNTPTPTGRPVNSAMSLTAHPTARCRSRSMTREPGGPHRSTPAIAAAAWT